MIRKILVLSVCLFLGASVASANHDADTYGGASLELLQKPIELSQGAGVGQLVDNSTELNRYINQSVAYLNVFDWSSAFRSARKAYKLDEKSALALSMQILSFISLDRQKTMKWSLSFAEKLEAVLEEQKGSLGSLEKLWSEFTLAMLEGNQAAVKAKYQELLAAHPENLEVLTLANWMSGSYIVQIGDQRGYNMAELKKALEISPDHAGANHYLAHINEGVQNHDEALKYTKKLSEVALESAHAQHMYGHVLPHHKQWDKAIEQFEKSHQIHLAWAQNNQVDPGEDWHYSHNLHLMGTAYFANGEGAKGLQMLQEGCGYDSRSCTGFIEMAISLRQFEAAQTLITMFSQGNPQADQVFAPYKDEIAFLKNGTALQRQQPYSQDFYYMISFILMKAPKGAPLPPEMVEALKQYTQLRLEGAGFDAWTTGLFELTRIIQMVQQQGSAELASELLQILKTQAPNIELPGVQ